MIRVWAWITIYMRTRRNYYREMFIGRVGGGVMDIT